MTEAGLNTINLSTLNTFQQILLFVLILMGSSIFVSISVVHIRKQAFERRFRREQGIRRTLSRGITKVNVNRSPVLSPAVPGRSYPPSSIDVAAENGDTTVEDDAEISVEDLENVAPAKDLGKKSEPQQLPPSSPSRADHIRFSANTRNRSNKRDDDDRGNRPRLLSFTGVGARPDLSSVRLSLSGGRPQSIHSQDNGNDTQQREGGGKGFVPDEGFVGRNSAFHGLSFADRERLGGTEYRAVVFLSTVVPLYFILWQFLGCLSMGAYINQYHSDVARQNGLNPW
jgi:hypothetical protein